MVGQLKNRTVLRPYQKRWANDPARLALAVKSAQVGYSTASAAWAVETCLAPKAAERQLVVFLSRSEAQSLELAEKAKTWVDGYQGVVAEYFPNQRTVLGDAEVLQHKIVFPGKKSRIIALAANPDTARGYTGHVVLDEFAFHKDADAIFKAAYRQTTLGYKLKILSTPNGQQGKFYDLARRLGLENGIRPRKQPVRIGPSGHRAIEPLKGQSPNDPITQSRNPWSGHWCDIYLAVEEGAPIDLEAVRAGCDEETWAQEYGCQFISQASDWISAELFQQCVSSEASVKLGDRLQVTGDRALSPVPCPLSPSPLYAGWDIARNRDLSVIWISELVGDVTWARGVIELKNMPTPDQLREARALLPHLGRINIDKSGLGLAIFEALEREFPGKVEGVQFTQHTKEAMAVLARRRMEERKCRLPDDDRVRHAFRSVKKTANALGQARFDAEHDSRYGHADHWWAFCLAEAAAEVPAYHLADVGAVVGGALMAGMRERIL